MKPIGYDGANDKITAILVKLANMGSLKHFNMNLARFEKKTGGKLSFNRLLSLAWAGAEDDHDLELVRFCWTASTFQAA